MQRKRGKLGPIGDAVADLDDALVLAIREVSPLGTAPLHLLD